MNTKNHLRTFRKFLLLILFIVLSVLNFIRVDANSHSVSDTLRPFLFQTLILALIFLIILYTPNKWGKKHI